MTAILPRPAVRALLALTLLLVPLGAGTRIPPSPAPGGASAQRAVAAALPGGEQVVQADRQPLSRAAAQRPADLGRFRPLPLGVLAVTALLAAAWRRRHRGGRGIHRRPRAASPAHASRAPPALRTA